MTAPVRDSPVLASLIKPLIVAVFEVSFSEIPDCKITEEKISINKQILVVIRIQLLSQTCLPAGRSTQRISQRVHSYNSESVTLLFI
jgi:hypothetical protein